MTAQRDRGKLSSNLTTDTGLTPAVVSAALYFPVSVHLPNLAHLAECPHPCLYTCGKQGMAV